MFGRKKSKKNIDEDMDSLSFVDQIKKMEEKVEEQRKNGEISEEEYQKVKEKINSLKRTVEDVTGQKHF
ncbi:MAG: hypothetical protein GXO25_05150 [Euryarchaeota archaeon]|nr:hypothetical protein [Euryarchaeota archaeon]